MFWINSAGVDYSHNMPQHKMVICLPKPLMAQELPADLECMKKAFQDQNYTGVETTAHKIKGGAVYVGTIRMKYACQYVERYWKSGQRDLFEALYHQAVSTIDETMTYIKGWLQQNKP